LLLIILISCKKHLISSYLNLRSITLDVQSNVTNIPTILLTTFNDGNWLWSDYTKSARSLSSIMNKIMELLKEKHTENLFKCLYLRGCLTKTTNPTQNTYWIFSDIIMLSVWYVKWKPSHMFKGICIQHYQLSRHINLLCIWVTMFNLQITKRTRSIVLV